MASSKSNTPSEAGEFAQWRTDPLIGPQVGPNLVRKAAPNVGPNMARDTRGWLRPHEADLAPDPAATGAGRRVGVLALQGAFAEHGRALRRLGCEVVEVRLPAHLDRCDALVMPGGESTTMSKLLGTSQLFDPIAARIAEGMPVFGTCAGMILLATDVLDGRNDQRSFGVLDVTVRRNGYGRQVDSFETDLAVTGVDDPPVHAVFIRAP